MKFVMTVLALALAGSATADEARATFAGGCFWCMETAYEGRPGVRDVVSGYAGGPEDSPSYKDVSAGKTGHLEAIQVVYDPAAISYQELLYIFWRNIDPLQDDGQFCDRGKQYRTAIFAHDAEQQRLAEASKAALDGRFDSPIVTRVIAESGFFPAEDYHQDFYKKDPKRYKSYRLGCRRDAQLEERWGEEAGGGH